MDMARGQIAFIERSENERRTAKDTMARYGIEWHRKLMFSAACLIFFFIGAPLGAIVRKGGLGLPVVIAVLFFLAFHVISYSTEQMVKGGDLLPWPGMWISTIAVLPVGLFLTWKAATDSPLLDRDAYHRAWEKLRRRRGPRHADPAVVQ
jgi:lipopolysaccharide export system permease protein